QGVASGQRRRTVSSLCGRAGETANRRTERRGRRSRARTTNGAVVEHVACRGGAGVGGVAEQVGGGGTRDRGRDVRLRGVADRGLQRLASDRLCGLDQRLQRGDAGVGGLQHLHAVADAVEEVADVAGAVVEGLRREEVGGVVESRIDLLAGGQAILRGGEEVGGRLEREQVLANRCRENNAGHCLSFWVERQFFDALVGILQEL